MHCRVVRDKCLGAKLVLQKLLKLGNCSTDKFRYTHQIVHIEIRSSRCFRSVLGKFLIVYMDTSVCHGSARRVGECMTRGH